MELRKLDVSEHGRTRGLWERVFSDDSKAFLDYYYLLKAKENEIYVLEEDEMIRSMLHLNPYLLSVRGETFAGHYIVGVATEEAYRGRGYMRTLLVRALEEMYRRKEWFTYLMPAAEEIYAPYDFRYIYTQGQRRLPVGSTDAEKRQGETEGGTEVPGVGLEMKSAGLEAGVLETKRKGFVSDLDATMFEAAELAEFFNQYFAGRWQVFAVRDEAYYQRQIFEQQSEGGGIRLLRSDGKLVGMFLYSREGELEVLEPLYLSEYEREFQAAVRRLAGHQETVGIYACEQREAVSVSACEQWEETPKIMARLLRPECVLSAMRVKEGCEMDCSFAVLDPILEQNSRIWRICGGEGDGGRIRVRETEDSQGVLTIKALTDLLFGMKSVEELEMEEGVLLSDCLREELRKLEPLTRVFLNELV